MRGRASEVFDEFLDRRLRGEAIEVESFLRTRPDLSEDECVELRALASTLELGAVDEAVPPPAPRLPESIGPYRVLSWLGCGGQGVVYLAEDVRNGRRAALKVLTGSHDAAADADRIARLQREAELIERLDHPGICKLYELGEHDGLHFVATEYVDGQTLAEWIAERRGRGGTPSAGDVAQALEIAEQVARALHAAHESGVVHRDVKPRNIVLSTSGMVVLLDFGLAKGASQGSVEVTQTGQVLGSPAYMAPEQLAADATELDRRTDVYSLGVTLYECLTLRRPYDAAGQQELFERIRRGGPPDPCRFNAGLDRRARALLERTLELERADRYADALALAEDLRRLRLGESLALRRPAPARRAARWIRRKPERAAAALTLVVLASSTALLALGWRDGREALSQADGYRMLAQSRDLLPSNPYLAMLLAIEGAERAPGPTAENTLLAVLDAQCERRMLVVRDSPISRCLRGPGSHTLITAAGDGTLRVWDAATWELERTLSDRGGVPRDLALSRDESRLAVFATDGTCRLWNTETWDSLGLIACSPLGAPRLAGFDALGRLITANGDGLVEVWDAERREKLLALGSGGDSLLGCTLDPEGRRAAVVTVRGGLRLFELGRVPRLEFEVPSRAPGEIIAAGFDPEGERVLVLGRAGGASVFQLATQHESPLEALADATGVFAFAPRGDAVLVARRAGSAGLWDPATGAHLRELRDCPSPVQRGLFHPGDDRLFTFSSDLAVRCWDTRTGELLDVLRGNQGDIVDCWLDLEAGSLVTTTNDGTLREWELATQARRSTASTAMRDLVSAHFDHAGERIACAADSGWVEVVERDSLRVVLRFRAGERSLHGAVFTPDDAELLTASSDRTARFFAARDGAPRGVLEHPAQVWDAQIDAEGRRVLTAAEDGRARVWDARERRVLLELVGHEGGVRCARFVGDGTRILTCSESSWDASVRLWDARTGENLSILRADGARPISVNADPAGRLALATGWWGTAQLWDLERGTLLRCWPAQALYHGFSASFSPDGAALLTSGAYPAARVWNASDGSERMTLDDGRRIPSYAEYSADGGWILTASGLGRLRLWPADPLARARSLVTREPTPRERADLGF